MHTHGRPELLAQMTNLQAISHAILTLSHTHGCYMYYRLHDYCSLHIEQVA